VAALFRGEPLPAVPSLPPLVAVPEGAANFVTFGPLVPTFDPLALTSGGDRGAAGGEETGASPDLTIFLSALEPLGVYLEGSGRASPREMLADTVFGKPGGALSGADDVPARLTPVEEAGYLLNSSLNQADDNALNVERLLRRQAEEQPKAPPGRPEPEEENGSDEEAPAAVRPDTGRLLWAVAAGVLGLGGLIGLPTPGRRAREKAQRQEEVTP